MEIVIILPFEAISKIVNQHALAPKEKIPKLQAMMDSLFKDLTKDEPAYFGTFFSRCVFIIENTT